MRVLMLVMPLLMPCVAQHAYYSFNTPKANLDNITSYLTWSKAESGNVFLSTQFFTGCSGAYFGGQFHSDNSNIIIFSMWDFNATAKSAKMVSPWCTRFGGEGDGAHCSLAFQFKLGVEYRFTISKEQNATGVLWSGHVTEEDENAGTSTTTFMGTLFVDAEGLPEDCSVLKPQSASFQEYFTGGSFYSAANWRGPFFDHQPHQNPGIEAVDANSDCGTPSTHSNVSSTVPNGPSGRPNTYYQMGGDTPHGCENSMWQHNPDVEFEKWPLITKPTATTPTGIAVGNVKTEPLRNLVTLV